MPSVYRRAVERLLEALGAEPEFRDALLGDLTEELAIRAAYDGERAAAYLLVVVVWVVLVAVEIAVERMGGPTMFPWHDPQPARSCYGACSWVSPPSRRRGHSCAAV